MPSYPIEGSPVACKNNNIARWCHTIEKTICSQTMYVYIYIFLLYIICKFMFQLQYHMVWNSIPINDHKWYAMIISYVVQFNPVEDAI